jgi:hypothetical protein
MNAASHSCSPALTALLYGPPVNGLVLGPHHLLFGDYVVSLTEIGGPRMPNGIECSIDAADADHVVIGDGHLVVGAVDINPGPSWDPAPVFGPIRCLPAGPEPLPSLAGWGEGLTPAGDDLLAGYVAGLVLLHGDQRRAARLVKAAIPRTTALSATLLRHAAVGEVPEPVHALLEHGDPRPLLGFGHSSGRWWLRGLVSAGLPLDHELAVMGSPTPAVAVRP